MKQDKFRESICQDLPADQALAMGVTQRALVGSTFGNDVSDPAWKNKPARYQASTSDRMIHPDTERRRPERGGHPVPVNRAQDRDSLSPSG